MINVVANETHLVGEVHLLDGLEQDGVTGSIIPKQIDQRQAFRRAVFEMPHVHIGPASIEQKTAVARRLVPVALMHVSEPEAVLLEYPIADATHGAGWTGWVVGQTTIFRFQAYDPVHNPNCLKVRISNRR